jgi:hypothetical protein
MGKPLIGERQDSWEKSGKAAIGGNLIRIKSAKETLLALAISAVFCGILYGALWLTVWVAAKIYALE